VDPNFGSDTTGVLGDLKLPTQTITKAMSLATVSAPPSNRIEIRPGVYNENLAIPSNVNLAGDDRDAVILNGTIYPVFTSSSDATVYVSNMTINYQFPTGAGGYSAATIVYTNCVFNVNLSSAGGYSMAVFLANSYNNFTFKNCIFNLTAGNPTVAHPFTVSGSPTLTMLNCVLNVNITVNTTSAPMLMYVFDIQDNSSTTKIVAKNCRYNLVFPYNSLPNFYITMSIWNVQKVISSGNVSVRDIGSSTYINYNNNSSTNTSVVTMANITTENADIDVSDHIFTPVNASSSIVTYSNNVTSSTNSNNVKMSNIVWAGFTSDPGRAPGSSDLDYILDSQNDMLQVYNGTTNITSTSGTTYNVTDIDTTIVATPSNPGMNLYLPDSTKFVGRILTIRNYSGSYNVTVSPSVGTQYVDNQPYYTLLPNKAITIQATSNGSYFQWMIIGVEN
jgi:hypothetical protein